MPKFSGADWLADQLPDDRQVSPFGVKVANILGQVYRGLYHIDTAVLSKKVLWNSISTLSVTVPGELATFDGDLLTCLVLCCQKAGVGVSILGSFKGYTRLMFSTIGAKTIGEFLACSNDTLTPGSFDPDNLTEFAERFFTIKKPLWQHQNTYSCAVEGCPWMQLQLLMNECHAYAIRGSIIGRSPHSVEVQFYRRRRDGLARWQRHPSLDEHRIELEADVAIDYEAT